MHNQWELLQYTVHRDQVTYMILVIIARKQRKNCRLTNGLSKINIITEPTSFMQSVLISNQAESLNPYSYTYI